MGNFYSNVTLPACDVDVIVATLEGAGRRAYVAPAREATIVFDEGSSQDPSALEALAVDLSRACGRPALAVLNHDDDLLWYALARDGRIVDRYESNAAARGGDAAALCSAFDAPDGRDAVHTLLRRPPAELRGEVQRHEALLRLLGLPVPASLLGYEYVRRGELAEECPDLAVRAVGGAPAVGTHARASRPAAPAPPAPSPAEQTLLDGLAAIMRDMPHNMEALARAEVEIAPRFEPLIGAGRVNALTACQRLERHIAAKGLARGGAVTADPLLAELLGQPVFPHLALTTLAMKAFGIAPLSAEQRAESATPEGRRRS